MKFLRKILFPLSILYGWTTALRNFLFDKGFLKSYSFDIPIIAVGNLSVGGTGKTPQIEYLIRLLSPNYSVATLSRGYKRKSKGFLLANAATKAEILGDEPYQMFQKFPQIQVAVDADRKNGIEKLLSLKPKPEIILLDDAFQHRRVKAGFYILLTSYDDLFCNDFMLPTGNLREPRFGAQRADVIIVTKCPKELSERAQNEIKQKINLDKPIFFSYIAYDEKVYNEKESQEINQIHHLDKLLLAGIAKPEPFFEYFTVGNNETMRYPDHHHYSENDRIDITKKANKRLIITTEKDYVRLKDQNIESLYYLPIKSSFISEATIFNQIILNYVGTSTTNRKIH